MLFRRYITLHYIRNYL